MIRQLAIPFSLLPPGQEPRRDRWRIPLIAGINLSLWAVFSFGIFRSVAFAGEADSRLLQVGYATIVICGCALAKLLLRPRVNRAFITYMGALAFAAALNVIACHLQPSVAMMWLGVMISYATWFLLCQGTPPGTLGRIIRSTCPVLILTLLSLGFYFSDELGTSTTRMQSFGLYSGLLLMVAFYFDRTWKRFSVFGFGLVGVYLSSNRGAVFAAAIGLAVVMVLRRKWWMAFMALPLYLTFAASNGPNEGLVAQFFQRKATQDISALTALEHSADDRLLLATMGVNMAIDNPLGIGLGRRYVLDIGTTVTSPHNGFIDVWLETGLQGVAMALILIGIGCTRAVQAALQGDREAQYSMGVIAYMLAKALEESYLLFNLGDFAVNILVIILLYYGFRDRPRRPVFAPQRRPGTWSEHRLPAPR